MIYRNIRVRATGQWVNVMFTFEKADPQNTPAQAHITSIAAALGVAPATLEAVEAETDTRTAVLLAVPVPDPLPLTLEQQAWAAATATDKIKMVGKRLGLER